MSAPDTARGLEIGRSIFREASDAFFVFDPLTGRVVDVNPAALRLTGFDRAEVLARPIHDLFTADGAGLERLIDALQKTQFFHSREGYALARSSGAPLAVNVSVSRIHTAPESLGLVVARDVSELRRAREGLERFFRHSPAPSAVLGADGRIRATNPAWDECFGSATGELKGRLLADLIHPDDKAAALGAMTARSPGTPALFEARVARGDGRVVWLSWCAGTIAGATYAVAFDITAHNEAEALRRAKEAAEAASEAKNRLLASVSHELRTPLSAMLGLIDVQVESASSAGDRALIAELRSIHRNGTDLARLIDDLLDLSCAEAGQLDIQRAACRPAEIVSGVLDLLRTQAAEKGLELTAELDPALATEVCTDGLRLRQILVNLVGNAIKYTAQGRIVVRVKREAPGSGGPALRFDVCDTGPGIPPDALDGLFQPFTRRGGRSQGAGLGLAISRSLAGLLGGTLEAESTPGQGSTFRLRIDAPAPEVPASSARAAPETTADAGIATPGPTFSRRVLVAEDHADNRRALSRRLEIAGLKVTAVADGQQATTAALAAAAENRPFDVILMDMNMPVTDGFEATAQLRAAGYRGAIIALTADARSEDRAECLKSGCDEHLPKPVDWQRLLSLISTLAPAGQPGPAPG
jgi:PAS domain S-box-containing protein